MLHKISRIALGLLGCLLGAAAYAADTFYATGEAYSLHKNALVYTESHTIDMQKHVQHAEYKDAHGVTIVRKQDEYQGASTQPAFRQDDLRDGSSFGCYTRDGKLTMFRDNGQGRLKEEILKAKDNLVIDVGLDHFMREHWEELLSHHKASLAFAHPYYLDVFALTASEEAAEESPITTKNPEWVYFRLQPSSFFVRMFGPDIHLAYARSDRRLMVFQGQSNIPDLKGEPQMVNVIYHYHESAPLPAAAVTQDALSPEETERLRKIHRNDQGGRTQGPW